MKVLFLASAAAVFLTTLALAAPRDAARATHAMPCTDIDGDGAVTVRDYFVAQTYFGEDVPPAPAALDMNDDGTVSLFEDLFPMRLDYGDFSVCQDTPVEPDGGTPPKQNPDPPSMTFSGGGGGTCSSETDPDHCVFLPGNVFTLRVDISGVPAQGHIAFQSQVAYGPLTYKPDVFLDDVVWPPAAMSDRRPGSPTGTEGAIDFASWTNFVDPAATTFEGALLELEVNCLPDEGFVTLALPAYTATNVTGAAVLLDTGEIVPVDPVGTVLVPAIDPDDPIPVVDTIDIHCYSPDSTIDSDGDGCTNRAELGLNPLTGGQRDPDSFWDLYDVWTRPLGDPSGWERDESVTLFGDVFGVVSRFGTGVAQPPTGEEALAATMTPPDPGDETSYHAAYDRSPRLPGSGPWDLGPPDGVIDLFTDIFGAAVQFGHDCA